MKTLRHTLTAAALALVSAGCGPLVELPGGGPAPSIYELRALDSFPGSLTASSAVVMIDEPNMPGGLRVDRIAIKPTANRVEYMPASRWSDRTAHLIHDHILQSLENAGAFRVIGSSAIDLPSDYRLKLDVRDFQAELDGSPGPDVKVEILAKLVTQGPVRIVGEKRFSARRAASDGTTDSVVQAFNRAMNEAVGDMAVWIANVVSERSGPDT